ncbi:hypothetical protein R1sor_024123 [Riccia sorocarpa]|uniref:Uncharacterized protein n=1 Tax=Riccia sorocarpa TaxID=122646 RepID=A0ABD3GPM8_9MARC
MATKQTRLYFDNLAARLKTKFSISRVWFVSLNVADASLVLWKHAEPDPVKCGNLLQSISNTKTVLEVLAMKDGGTFVRLRLEPKNMDRQTSKTALNGDLLSGKDSQIGLVINNVLRKQSGYKLVERECIKRALNSGVFVVLQREAASYLPHPELASTAAPRKAVAATNETDWDEEREIARDIKASQRHEAARLAEAKSAKSGRSAKDKGKVVLQETQKKKPSVPSHAPREKLLGSSFAVATTKIGKNSRESKTDSLKRKRESLVTPPPPPKVLVTETSESNEEEKNIAS